MVHSSHCSVIAHFFLIDPPEIELLTYSSFKFPVLGPDVNISNPNISQVALARA